MEKVCVFMNSVLWSNRFVAGLLTRKPVFDPGESMWDLWQPQTYFSHYYVFLCRYHSTNIPFSLSLRTTLARRTSGRIPGIFILSSALSDIGGGGL